MTAGELIKLLKNFAPETQVEIRQLPTLTERFEYEFQLVSRRLACYYPNGEDIEGEYYTVLCLEPAR